MDRKDKQTDTEENEEQEEDTRDRAFIDAVKSLRKGMKLHVNSLSIKEGKHLLKRYSSGTLILAMENAGQLIEDEELRNRLKARNRNKCHAAEILNKLVKISYLNLNKKTQIITPTLLGELIYEVVNASIRSLLNPELTASWEKGLTYVEDGKISNDEYMEKLEGFVARMVNGVKELNNQTVMINAFRHVASFINNYNGKYFLMTEKIYCDNISSHQS